MEELEILKTLTVSTSHLSGKDIQIIHQLDQLEDEYSYQIYTLYGTEIEEDLEEIKNFNKTELNNSETLISLFSLARKNKCHFIRFDIDGPELKNYPLFKEQR